MSTFGEKYGPTALIAGGSEGVGEAYARQLAEKGLDLVLVARTSERLEATRAKLADEFPECSISAITADLTDPATPKMLAEKLADQEIGLLIYNAGSNWKHGEFVDVDLAYYQTLTALNATAPMAITHHFGGLMKARGRGGIILISSLAYLAGSPHIAVYSAAKAFSTTLAEALWFEMKPYGVDVMSHALGSVDTPFIQRNFPQAYGQGDQPEDVAPAGLEALGTGPVLRAGKGDDFHKMLGSMTRAEAVQAMAAAGKRWDEG